MQLCFRFAPMLVAILAMISIQPESISAQETKTCADFEYQQDAQEYYDAGGGRPTDTYWGMDRDGNGKACESLPMRVDTDGGIATILWPTLVAVGIGGVAFSVIRNRDRKSVSANAISKYSKPVNTPSTNLTQIDPAQPEKGAHAGNNITINTLTESRSTSKSGSTATMTKLNIECPWSEDATICDHPIWNGHRLNGFIDKEVLNQMPYDVYLRTNYWRKVSEISKKDADYRCQKEGCGRQGGYLEVHHLRYDQAYERPEDLMVLCRQHHLEVHGREVPEHLKQ